MMLAVALATTPAVARAQSPEQLLQRIFADPGFMFHHRHRAAHAVASRPADTPLIDVPMPHLRPGSTGGALAYQGDASLTTVGPLASVPLPHVSPEDAPHQASALPPPRATPTPAPRGPEIAMLTTPPLPTPAPPPPAHVVPAPAVAASCGGALIDAGVVAEPLPQISAGVCGMPDPVKLTALAGGAMKIDGGAIVDCAIAGKLGRWITESVEPKAAATLGGKVTALRVVDSYSCRNRDGIATAKLSEHAHGNAIDIGAFQIDGGRWITIGDAAATPADTIFLAAVRASACGPFTTVLGPGSDPYHATHFHLDLAERRTAGPSHGLLCQ
jgi:hypothetical protein